MTSEFDTLTFFYSSECAKFGDKMCKICKISPNDLWPHCVHSQENFVIPSFKLYVNLVSSYNQD